MSRSRPVMLDTHIHLFGEGASDGAALEKRLKQAGMGGGIILSRPPPTFWGTAGTPAERIGQVMDLAAGRPGLYPFFWIDAIAPDAVKQAERAVAAGIAGFKVICDRHEPGDARALRLFKRIAALGKPILFHSGILWDGKPSSGYNRPVLFEPLMMIQGLRFAMAHLSWPWTDECLALYGKLYHARKGRPDRYAELFLDLTPGTPKSYREDVFRKLWNTYPVRDNVLFGSDSTVENYDVKAVKAWIRIDRALCRKLRVETAAIDGYFGRNLLRFVNG